MSWDNYSGGGKAKPDRKLLIAGGVAIVAILVAAVMLFTRGDADSNTANGTGTGANTATGSTDKPGKLQQALDEANTPTTGPQTPDPIANPESEIMTPEQLAYQFPQSRSGLDADAFAALTAAAKAFNTAEVTGEGKDNWGSYYNSPAYFNSPWMQPATYKVQYAYAQQTSAQSLVKTTVWFSGTTSTDNSVINQAVATVYFRINNNGTVTPQHPDDIENQGLESPGFNLEIVGPDDTPVAPELQ